MTHQNPDPSRTAALTDPLSIGTAVSLQLFRFMLRLRRIEESIAREYRVASEIKCPVHFSVGQEAVPAALSLLINPDDHLYSHHRSHGYYFAKQCPLNEMLAELFGRETGANGGLAGSQEISYPPLNFCSGAILTGASSVAVGSALAFKLNETDQLALAGFGEAATEEGVFWEAISYASTSKLPLVYLCENNKYSMFSPQNKRQPSGSIFERVAKFQIHSEAAYGNDALAAYQVLQSALKRARQGDGPQFIEFFTYRQSAHVGPEPDDFVGYRSTEEQEFWKLQCPILRLERQLLEANIISDAEIEQMEQQINQEIQTGLDFARGSELAKSFIDKNYASQSSVAEKLLPVSWWRESFDSAQAETRLAPY